MHAVTLSNILIFVKTNSAGVIESRNFEWTGKSPYAALSSDFLTEIGAISLDKIQLGPYKLLKIEYDFLSDSWLYVRADKSGQLRLFLYPYMRGLDRIYRHAIKKLAVWNLASVDDGKIPSIEDVYIVKWFQNTMNR